MFEARTQTPGPHRRVPFPSAALRCPLPLWPACPVEGNHRSVNYSFHLEAPAFLNTDLHFMAPRGWSGEKCLWEDRAGSHTDMGSSPLLALLRVTSPAGSSGLVALQLGRVRLQPRDSTGREMILEGRPHAPWLRHPSWSHAWRVRLGSLGLGETLQEAGNWGGSDTASFSWIKSQKGLVS